MNAEQLRELQAPLKAQYKEDPTRAMVTLHAKGRVSQSEISCTLETGKPNVPAGLHPATGGDGSKACSGDMLLEALVACAGVTLASVATAMGIELKAATVSADGDVDFRGTLGMTREAPVGFVRIHLSFSIETTSPPEKVQKLIELTERYCVVAQTIAKETVLEISQTTA
jgi:uncharacterized OsmC-like protein